MIPLKISENIVKLRHKKGITQDELADFLGVTKASVSKWENKQSCPDILLLPQLAAYFDVTIDQLMGYEPQLSPEQIKKCYSDLAGDFARLPFDQAMGKTRRLVKEYYSCYPLLLEIVLLWINHFMLSPDKKVQEGILNEGVELCDHILSSCSDMALQNQVIALKAVINLQQGKYEEVIDALEPIMDPKRMSSRVEGILIQAYQMSGDLSKAELYSQVSIYLNMGSMISSSMGLISIKMQDYEECQKTIKRIKQLMDAYDMESLNPNTALQFHYQCAVVYCLHNKLEEALMELESFVKGCATFIDKGIELHGDEYFNRLDEWVDNLALGSSPPRNKRVVIESLLPAFENPMFSPLFNDKKYIELKEKIKNIIKEVQ
jgi:transcriptional regulator with XRE-family HTH domain